MNPDDQPVFPDPFELPPPSPEFAVAPPPPPPKPWPAWGFLDLILLLVILVPIIFLAGGIVISVAHAFPAFRHVSIKSLGENAIVGIVVQALCYLLWLCPVWLTVCFRSGESFFPAIRWNWPRPRTLAIVMGIGVAVTLVLMLTSNFVPEPENAPFEELFKDRKTAYALSLFGIFFAPFFEELFFRGLLYPVLRRRLHMFVSVLITASLFGLLHAPEWNFAWGPVLIIFLVGVALTLVRELANSLAASWLVHVIYNGLLMAIAIIATHGFTQH